MAGTGQVTEGLPNFLVQTLLGSEGSNLTALDCIEGSSLQDRASVYVVAESATYRWFATSTALQSLPDIVKPQGYNVSDPGRWFKIVENTQFSNVVAVSTASDLPAASGGVITLETGKLYQVNGVVDLGSSRIVVPAGAFCEASRCLAMAS